MRDRNEERNLRLTEEEAMGLLEIVMMSPAELTLDQREAVIKLSDFCRQFMRDQSDMAVLTKARIETALPPRCAA